MKINFKIFVSYLIILVLVIGTIAVFHFQDIITFNSSSDFNIFIWAGIIILILILVIGFFLNRSISKNFNLLYVTLNRFFTEKNITDKISSVSGKKNDFGKIFKELIHLHTIFRSYSDYAEKVTNGNLNAELKVSDNEFLGTALIDIKENLVTYEKEKIYNLNELERNNWYQSGVTEFTLLLQQDFKSTDEMAYPVIKKLAEHVGIDQIGIFILKNKDNKELLILEAAYAYDKKKLLDTEIEIGESLVGKCAKEQKIIRIDDLPEGYTYISSGLGEDTPASLILIPLMHEKKLFGVLELATLHILSDYKINFLNIISERIAAEISNINSKKLRAKLAEDYKIQSKELTLKEKKAEEKISELIEEKDHLINSQKIILSEIELLNSLVPKIILDEKGQITDVNAAAEELYHIKKETVLNKAAKDIFTKHHNFTEIYTDILQGNIRQNRFFNKTKTEETAEKYIPVKNGNNEIHKIILTAMKIKRS